MKMNLVYEIPFCQVSKHMDESWYHLVIGQGNFDVTVQSVEGIYISRYLTIFLWYSLPSRVAWLWTHFTLGTDTVPGMTVTSGKSKFGTSRIWDYTTDRIEHPVGSIVFNISCHTNLHYSLNHLHLLLSWNYVAPWFKYPQCKQGLLLSDHFCMNCKWLPWMRILRKLNINTRRPNITSLNTRQLGLPLA